MLNLLLGLFCLRAQQWASSLAATFTAAKQSLKYIPSPEAICVSTSGASGDDDGQDLLGWTIQLRVSKI